MLTVCFCVSWHHVNVLQELSKAKALCVTERATAEEELQKVKTQIRQEEVGSLSNFTDVWPSVPIQYLTASSVHHPHSRLFFVLLSEQQEHVLSLEEKLHSVRSSLQELQLHGSQQKQTISELQLKNNQQNMEMESLRRRVDELNQVWKPPLHPNGGII